MTKISLRIQKHIIATLKKDYKLNYLYEVPHYSIMTNEKLRMKRLVRKLSKREQANYTPSAEIELLLDKEWSREYYLKQISIENPYSCSTPLQEYFNTLKNCLLDPHLKVLWMCDSYWFKIWEADKANKIEILYDGLNYINCTNNKTYKHSNFMIENYHLPEDPFIEETIIFPKYAEKRIAKSTTIYPLKFDYASNTKTNTLILENTCQLLQLELLFNNQIVMLYDNRNIDQKEKYLSYAENNNTKKISNKYSYNAMKTRFKTLLEKEKASIDTDGIIYSLLLEKLTERILCDTFLKYYDIIMDNLAEYQLPLNKNKQDIHLMLLDILSMFIQIPSLIYKKYILIEMMEPVIYWKGNLYETLTYVIDALYEILNELKIEYKRISDYSLDELSDELDKYLSPHDLDNTDWVDEAEKIFQNENPSKNFKLINCFILNKLL